MVDLSKFTFSKKILIEIITLISQVITKFCPDYYLCTTWAKNKPPRKNKFTPYELYKKRPSSQQMWLGELRKRYYHFSFRK